MSCVVTKILDCTCISCDGVKDHECNEEATVYETVDGERFFFTDRDEANKWYDENYMKTRMGSVACSICESALIDSAYKL